MKKMLGILFSILLIILTAMSAFSAEIDIGDINLDGKVTATDARIVLRFAARLEEYNSNQMLIADANKDGKVSAVDARLILRVSARLMESPGVVNIDGQISNDGRINTSGVIGMSIKDFRSEFGSVIEIASSSDEKYYKNKDITLVCDPAIYKDGSVSAFIITSEKYSFNGVGIGDTADRVQNQFAEPWVSTNSYSDNKTFEMDNLIVTVKIKDGKVAELTVEVKITSMAPTTEIPATQEPHTEVTTTQPSATESPTTQAPTTEATTTEAPTTDAVILQEGEIRIEDTPKEILAIYNGDFGIKGTTTNLTTGEVNNINIYTKNKNARLEMDGYSINNKDVTIAVIVKAEKNSNKIYLVNSSTNKYVYMDALTMKFVGIKPEELDVNFNLDNKESKKLCVTKTTENGTEYEVYSAEKENPKTQVYMKDGKIVKIKTTTSILTVNEFIYPTDDNLYSVDKLTKSDILSLFL